jgi:hypothetical protein
MMVLYRRNHTRKRYTIFCDLFLFAWWPCTGAFLPATIRRKRYTISAISFSLHGGLLPAPFSMPVLGRDTPFLRNSFSLYGGLVPALFSRQPYEEEIRHFCESLSLCMVALYRRLSPCMEGGDTPFLRYLSLCLQFTHDAARKSLRDKKEHISDAKRTTFSRLRDWRNKLWGHYN